MQFNSLFLTCLLLLGVGTAATAQQREVVIPSVGLNIIQTTIEADLASMGVDVVENTTYILERGKRYAYSTQYQPEYSLTIVASQGDGFRPQIVPVGTAAGEAPRFIRQRGPGKSLTLIGIELDQIDTFGEHTDNAPIRPQGAGVRYYVEDCVFDFQRFEVARTAAVDITLIMVNNIISRNYQRDNWYKNGGLFFQNGNAVDTLIVRDNSYYNTPGVAFFQLNGDDIEYLEIKRNTFVNVGGQRELFQYGGPTRQAMIDMGAALDLVCEDNIFYNIGFMGVQPAFQDSFAIFNYVPSDTSRSFRMSNNNFFQEPAFMANTPDTAIQIPMFTSVMDSFLNTLSEDMNAMEYFTANNISEEIDFDNAPMNEDKFVQAKINRWANPGTATNDELILDTVGAMNVDFGYSTDLQSYSAATDGGPLGSRRYFPDFMVSTQDYQLGGGVLTVHANFPNPASDYTNLRFDLGSTAEISVEIYDLNGRQVHQLAPRRFQAGTDLILPVTGLDLTAGLYTYAIIAEVDGRRTGSVRQLVVR